MINQQSFTAWKSALLYTDNFHSQQLIIFPPNTYYLSLCFPLNNFLLFIFFLFGVSILFTPTMMALFFLLEESLNASLTLMINFWIAGEMLDTFFCVCLCRRHELGNFYVSLKNNFNGQSLLDL